MTFLGDFAADSTFDCKFTTVTTTGAPTALLGTPVISAYLDNSIAQLTAGITLTVDFDAVTGLNNVRVVATTANGYTVGSNFQLVITTGTVGGTSVVGYVVAQFSIQARSALRPTVATRTLDVSAGGEAGVDWANIGSPTTVQNLSATVVATATAVTTVNGLAAGVITAASIAADAITAAKIADGAIDAATFAAGAITAASIAADAITDAKVAADVTIASVTGAVGSVTGAVGSVTGAVGSVTGAVGSVATGGLTNASFAAETGFKSIRSNTAQAGAATTITLDASASAVDSFYVNQLLVLTGGTGVGQARFITAYVGATKVATVATWTTTPDATSTFAILPAVTVPAGTGATAIAIADEVMARGTLTLNKFIGLK